METILMNFSPWTMVEMVEKGSHAKMRLYFHALDITCPYRHRGRFNAMMQKSTDVTDYFPKAQC